MQNHCCKMEFELEIDPNYTSDEYDSQLSASDQNNSSSDEEVDDAEHDFPVLDGLWRKIEEKSERSACTTIYCGDWTKSQLGTYC